MIKKIVYFFLLAIVIALVALLVMRCTADKKPASNTEEYRQLHGYVEGQENEIRVGGVLFRFPAGKSFYPRTSGPIVKGQASVIRTGIRYPVREGEQSRHDGVRVEFRYGATEDSELWKKFMEDERWKEIIYREDLNLMEYHRERYNGAWGYITYVAKSDEDRTPIGSLIRYSCAGNPDGRPDQKISSCWGGYSHRSNINIWYFIDGHNMHNWKAIHNEVVKFADSVIIEE